MLTPDHKTIIYLMFLNGILFLGLNFIAYSLVYPGTKRSKRLGYVFISAALLMVCVMQEYRALVSLGFSPNPVGKILLGGFVFPVLLISLVYYRIQNFRRLKKSQPPDPSITKPHEHH